MCLRSVQRARAGSCVRTGSGVAVAAAFFTGGWSAFTMSVTDWLTSVLAAALASTGAFPERFSFGLLSEPDLPVDDLQVGDVRHALCTGLLGNGKDGVVHSPVPGQLVLVRQRPHVPFAVPQQFAAGVAKLGQRFGVAIERFLQVAVTEGGFPGGGVGLSVFEAFDGATDPSGVDDRARIGDAGAIACLRLDVVLPVSNGKCCRW